jgi:hypothetical protein
MTFYAATRLFLKTKAYFFGKTPIGTEYGQGPRRLSPGAYGREVRYMQQICEERGIPFIYVVLPVNRYYPWIKSQEGKVIPFEAYNQVVAESASNQISSTLDLRSSPLGEHPETYFIDDMHLSGLGAAYVSERLAQVLLATSHVNQPTPLPSASQ